MENKTFNYPFFYNSQNGDRVYDADSFEYWLKKFFTTGVFEGDLQVTSTGGMNVSVGSGYCNLDGKVMIFNNPTSFTIETAEELNDRVDSIIIQRNDTERNFSILYKIGTPAVSPTAPELVRSNGIYEVALAHIKVTAGLISISQANITDTRMNKELCGYVTGTVENIDFSQITMQWEDFIKQFKDTNTDAFNTWFESIKGQLDEDAATALQNQINDINEEIAKKANQSDLTSTNTNLQNQINSLGFIGLKTATVSDATATVTFAGNLTSDAYTFLSSVNNTNTIEQLEAMGECKPLITSVAVSGANTVVTITNKSGTAPSTAFLFDVICIRTGVAQ